MTISDMIKLATRDMPNNLQSDNILISDAFYKAVTEMQEDAFCSVHRGRITASSSAYYLEIAPIFYGSDYHPTNAPYNCFPIIPVRVDAVWVVTPDGLTPLMMLDGKMVEYKKYLKDASGVSAIETSGSKTVIRLPFDVNGYTFEFWLRYKIPYYQGAFTNTVTISGQTVDIRNSLLETVPERYHDLLIRGVKYNIYNSLMERTNSEEYAGLRNVYENEWKNKALPRIKQESNRPISKGTTYVIKVPQIYEQND